MGGEQAAGVMSQIAEAQMKKKGKEVGHRWALIYFLRASRTALGLRVWKERHRTASYALALSGPDECREPVTDRAALT